VSASRRREADKRAWIPSRMYAHMVTLYCTAMITLGLGQLYTRAAE
jgi:hypothetical protein